MTDYQLLEMAYAALDTLCFECSHHEITVDALIQDLKNLTQRLENRGKTPQKDVNSPNSA